MTDFSTISSISSTQTTRANASQTEADQDQTQLIDDYETFLTLLTTQIQNQDPTEPMDSNEFTDQLVQFSTVEQQIKTNDLTEQLIAINQTANANSLISYVGSEIEAVGDFAVLENSSATWNLDAAADVDSADILVSDQFGNIVHSETVDLPRGESQFRWDGQDSAGKQYADGTYLISVEAVDADGNAVDVSSSVNGVVSEVDFTTSEPSLVVGDTKIPLSSVLSVSSSL